MKPYNANISDLQDKDDRVIAKLARIATCDTVFGGAKAMVIAKRLDNMAGSLIDAMGVVSDVYAASIGRTLPQYNPCFCPECGQAVLGEEEALNCCYEQ